MSAQSGFPWAVKTGDLVNVKQFIERDGEDVNQVESGLNKRTPLHWAADYGQADVASYLISKVSYFLSLEQVRERGEKERGEERRERRVERYEREERRQKKRREKRRRDERVRNKRRLIGTRVSVCVCVCVCACLSVFVHTCSSLHLYLLKCCECCAIYEVKRKVMVETGRLHG